MLLSDKIYHHKTLGGCAAQTSLHYSVIYKNMIDQIRLRMLATTAIEIRVPNLY